MDVVQVVISSEGEVCAAASAVYEGEGVIGVGYERLKVGEKGVDLFEFVAHGWTYASVVIHDAQALEEGVWAVVGEGIAFGAVVFAIGLGIWLGGFCAFEEYVAFFGDADVEVFAGGLDVDLSEG